MFRRSKLTEYLASLLYYQNLDAESRVEGSFFLHKDEQKQFGGDAFYHHYMEEAHSTLDLWLLIRNPLSQDVFNCIVSSTTVPLIPASHDKNQFGVG